MTDIEDVEHLLDCSNVVAVSVDPDGTVRAFVSQKCDEHELNESDIVSHNLPDDQESDVHDLSLDKRKDAFDLRTSNPKDRHRPVLEGISEMNVRGTAATAGHFPALVTDPTAGEWDTNALPGTFVRLSNNHVYALVDSAPFGSAILSPSPMDYGRNEDTTGRLVGRVPIEDGVTVDIAARTIDSFHNESTSPHGLPDDWPTGIQREGYRELVGENLTKTGRTTGVTEGELISTGASINVNMGGSHGVIVFRDQLITETHSQGGDSGSPVFHTQSGALVGMLFAGSDYISVVNPARSIEQELGVELLAETPWTLRFAQLQSYLQHLYERFDPLGDGSHGDSPLVLPQSTLDVLTDRRREILRVIQDEAIVIDSLLELTEHVDAAPSTIRRDIDQLEAISVIEVVKNPDDGRKRIPKMTSDVIVVEPLSWPAE